MNPEWLLLALTLAAALGLLLHRRPRGRLPAALAVISASLVGLGAVLWQTRAARHARSEAELRAAIPREGRDNYVSSKTCQACHPGEYASWHRTYHRTMTQVAGPETVVGDFENVTLELAGEVYRLEQRDGEYWVDMPDPDVSAGEASRRVRKRIGLLTGSHHMQVYWIPSRAGNGQRIFPFAWLIEDRRWAPFHNTFLRDPGLPPERQTWNANCINCHATGGQPRPDGRTRQFDTRAGELGIACEACHGEARDHVERNRNPLRRWSLRGPAEDPTIVNPARLDAKRSSEVCGQCHGIHWIGNREDHYRYGSRFRPGHELARTTPVVQPTRLEEQPWLHDPLRRDPRFLPDRFWPDGMVRVSGRDFNGMIEAPCYQRGQMSCLSCHSMHHAPPVDQLIHPPASNESCLQCHPGIGARLTEHTRHAAGSSGSLCYNCHMPHTTYGLLKAIRSHHIDSPSLASDLGAGRPNACNLCHLDRTLEWTARHLTAWYGQPPVALSAEQRSISAAVRAFLKGDAGQRALIAWHLGWEPAREASGSQWMIPYLAEGLKDPYSAVRHIAHRALLRVDPSAARVPYDFVGSEADRVQASQAVLELWPGGTSQSPAALLLNADGSLNSEAFHRLLEQRDHRSIDLQE